jgi:hypothetical protein
MKYSDIKTSVLANFALGNHLAVYISGKPGGGKSALTRDIARTMGILPEHYIEFNPSLRDPVDVLGVPNNHGSDCTRWLPPEEFWQLREDAADDRPRFLNIEEFSDASVPMQNPMCRIILDRMAGGLKLHHNLYIVASGNRTQDKSGANRVTTKLANRVMELEFDENLDDWCEWALDNGISPIIIQFLRFRANLLSDFDPGRTQNPTPRSWEKVNYVDPKLSSDLYFGNIKGLVGEGAAAEFTGFKRVYESLPDIDELLMHPDKVKVPTEPNVLYALTGALAHRATPDNFDRVFKFIDRIKPEFQVMCVQDAVKLNPKNRTTKAFTTWAVKNGSVLM